MIEKRDISNLEKLLDIYEFAGQRGITKVEDLLQRGRVDYIYPADYSENSGLDNTVKNIIQKMAISETLYREYSKQKHEINN